MVEALIARLGEGSALGPLLGFAVGALLGLRLVRHAAVLTGAAAVGSRLLPDAQAVSWLRLDLLVGVLLLAGAAYYLFRVANGDVTTVLPGEAGSTLMP